MPLATSGWYAIVVNSRDLTANRATYRASYAHGGIPLVAENHLVTIGKEETR
jgi:hypothetical protein